MLYDVVVANFRLNAPERPAKVLERVLQVGPEQARALLRQFPAVVVSRAERHRAEEVLAQLEAAGAKGEVRASVAPSLSPRASARPAGGSSPPGAARAAVAVHVAAAASVALDIPRAQAVSPAPAPITGPAAPPEAAWTSVPAELVAVAPANDVAVRPAAVTAYQLGDLDLNLGKPRAPAPSAIDQDFALEDPLPAPAVDLPPPEAEARLELEEPVAARPAKAQATVPAKAPEPKPKRAAPAATGPSSDGTQTFGGGFDDDEAEGPALELDGGSRWRGDNTVGLDKPKGGQRVSAKRAGPPRERPKTPASFSDGWGQSVFELLKFGFGLTVVVSTVLGALLFVRDPEALKELCGLVPPPPVDAQVAQVIAEGMRIADLEVVPGKRRMFADYVADTEIAVSADLVLHPLMRLVPNLGRGYVAEQLRFFASEVEPISAEGMTMPGGVPLRVDCMLVRQEPDDVGGFDLAVRIGKLLRTGYLVELPAGGDQWLATQLSRGPSRKGKRPRYIPLCLAL